MNGLVMAKDTSLIQEVYDRWEPFWERKNPKPKPPASDRVLYLMQITVVLGSILLSGTRTGNVTAEIGSATKFGEKIGYLGLGRAAFVTAEAILALVTFDAGILLAGYLLGEHKVDRRWYYVLLAAALFPALAANSYPGLYQLFGWVQLQAVVDLIVGVCSPLMAFVSGRVLGVLRAQRVEVRDTLESDWKARKGRAWPRSAEYKAWKVEQKEQAVAKASTVLSDVRQQILGMAQNGGATVAEISSALGVPTADVVGDVVAMTQEGVLVREGPRVLVPDF